MPAILDTANVHGELWEDTGNAAGRGFRNAVERGNLRLIGGGSQFKKELAGSGRQAQKWCNELRRAGRMQMLCDEKVDARGGSVRPKCASDDPHIIALAQMSGARLLYSNDKGLHRDFTNPELVGKPPMRGQVYSTALGDGFTKDRRALLARHS